HAVKLYREAESLARTAQRADPDWPEPYLMLARIIGWRAFLAGFDSTLPAAKRDAPFDSAIAYTEAAFRLNRRARAAALEMRGTIRFHRYGVAPPQGDSAEALLDLAESDLRQALLLDDRRARAASTLFFINYTRGRLLEAR